MAKIHVEVVYALPDRQLAVALELAAGSTVADSLEASGILRQYPGIDVAKTGVGIWGRRVGLDQPLDDGDRVEIYRGLIADPKLARRQRAARLKGARRQKAR